MTMGWGRGLGRRTVATRYMGEGDNMTLGGAGRSEGGQLLPW